MTFEVRSLRTTIRTPTVPVVYPKADRLVALAVDATPASEEEEAADKAAHQNVKHIPMSQTGLPFQKTMREMSIGPSSHIILVRTMMMTRPTLLEES